MKILVICSHYPPMASPEGKHALMLCENLAERGAEVHLLTSVLGGEVRPSAGFTLHPKIQFWSWRGAQQLRRATKRIQPDAIVLIYVSWIYGDHPMITFAPLFLRTVAPRAAFLTLFENTVGSPSLKTFPQKVRWQLAAFVLGGRKLPLQHGALLEKSDAIVTLTTHHLDQLAVACPSLRSRAAVIPAPALLRVRPDHGGEVRTEGRARLGLARDDPAFVLIFFGYIYPGKGVETLLEAISLSQQQGSRPLRLIVAGKVGPELKETLEKLEAHLGLADRVTWLGHTEDEVISAYLRASDAAVLPFDEGIRLNNSSFAVCAMHGLPIITTRGKNLEAPFLDRKNVLLCAPKDAAALARAIDEVVASTELRRELGLGSQEMARSIFAWDAIISTLLSFVETTIQRVREPRAAG